MRSTMLRVGLAGTALAALAAACRGGERSGAAPESARATTAAAPESARTGAMDLTRGGPYVFVTNEDGESVTVIDSRSDSVVATLQPGTRPRGVHLSPDKKTLYVAVSGSPKGGPGVDESKLPPPDRSKDGLAEIDLATGQLKGKLNVGHDPEEFHPTPDGKYIYVSNEDAGTATDVEVATGMIVARIPVGGEPEGVTVRPDGKEVWVTSEEKGQVTAIAIPSNKVVATIKTGLRPRSVAFTPDGKKAYVPAEVSGNVTVVDVATHKPVKTITMPSKDDRSMGSIVSPDGARAYVTNGRGGTLAVIDTKADSIIAYFPVGKRPWGIDITPDGKKIYTANGPGNDVSVIDAATHQVMKHIPAGQGPWGVEISK